MSFCGTLRAYTLRCNRALLLAQPNLENRQETFAHQGGNVVILSRYPSYFLPPFPLPPRRRKIPPSEKCAWKAVQWPITPPPCKNPPPTQKTHVDPLYARLNGILDCGGWVVFQNPSFFGGFLAGEIPFAGSDRKQARPEQPKPLRVPWVFVFPVVNSLGVTAMAVFYPFPVFWFSDG